MAKTIAQGFAKLKTNLEITDLQASTVSTRHTNVREAMAKELTVLDSFLTGSYVRSTMIAPLAKADIDVFVVLDPKYYGLDGQATLLDKVRDVLKKTYPQSPRISRNGQAVTITFTDFIVDVVPGFNRKGGGYLIPDSIGQRWIGTNPKVHVAAMTESNKAHSGDLVPLVKMLKAWNREHSSTLRSFHLEVLAMQILNGTTITDLPSGVWYVLDKAYDDVTKKNPDPAGIDDDVGNYLKDKPKMDAARDRLENGRTRAKSALDLAKDGKIEEAFGKWCLTFGDYFPAYG